MEIYSINLLAVLLATFVGMVLGALWYSPILFGNKWMQCLGKTPETLGSAKVPMIGSVIASLLSAIGVSLLFTYIGISSLSMAINVGLILGILIIFPALLSDNLFCGWGKTLLLIQAGYRVLSVFLMTIVYFYMVQ
jgi:hypothetical protein